MCSSDLFPSHDKAGAGADVNNWVNIPWEFTDMYKSSKTIKMARRYQYWKCNAIHIKIKNPTQMYSINADGTLAFAGSNQNAKLYTFLDSSYQYGPVTSPYDNQNYYKALMAAQLDGFDATTKTAFFPKSYTFDEFMGPRHGHPNVQQHGLNSGNEIEFHWKIRNKKGDWRATTEWLASHAKMRRFDILTYQNTTAVPYSDMLACFGTQEANIPPDSNIESHVGQWFRIDNWSSFYMHPRWTYPLYQSPLLHSTIPM